MIRARRSPWCLHASVKIGAHNPTSPDRASSSISHIIGIKLRSPLLILFDKGDKLGGRERVGGGEGGWRGASKVTAVHSMVRSDGNGHET